jgi:hypothetical protein
MTFSRSEGSRIQKTAVSTPEAEIGIKNRKAATREAAAADVFAVSTRSAMA